MPTLSEPWAYFAMVVIQYYGDLLPYNPFYYKTAIRLSILFAKEIIPKEFHVFVHNLNIEYSTELEKLGGKLRSIQHVMSFDWLKNAPTPLDFAYIAYLSSGQLAESKILLDDTINLLKDGFPHVDNTRDLIEELLYSKCNFVLYIFNKRALGVLIANENFVNEVRIEYLAVSKSYRRLGIATKLLHTCCKRYMKRMASVM